MNSHAACPLTGIHSTVVYRRRSIPPIAYFSHFQRASHQGRGGMGVEFPAQILAVSPDCVKTHKKLLRDLLRRMALRDQLENLRLTTRQVRAATDFHRIAPPAVIIRARSRKRKILFLGFYLTVRRTGTRPTFGFWAIDP